MVRTFLLVLLVFVVWRMMRTVFRVMSSSKRDSGKTRSQSEARKPPEEKFRDIQDADFEDLPPEKKR